MFLHPPLLGIFHSFARKNTPKVCGTVFLLYCVAKGGSRVLSIVFERTMKKLFASLVVAIAAMCFAPQATAAKLCATENMTN